MMARLSSLSMRIKASLSIIVSVGFLLCCFSMVHIERIPRNTATPGKVRMPDVQGRIFENIPAPEEFSGNYTVLSYGSHYTLSEEFAVSRRAFPELNPEVCIASLSCHRPEMLDATLKTIIAHMEDVEPNIRYEVAVVDNGSLQKTRNILIREIPVERVGILRENYGVGAGINLLYFGLCRWSNYILAVEDDWLYKEVEGMADVIAKGIHVMESDPQIVTLYLRLQKTVALNYLDKEWKQTKKGVDYEIYQPKEGAVYGTFATGGALLHRKRMESVGMLGERNTRLHGKRSVEAEYNKQLAAAGFRGAHLLLPNAQKGVVRFVGGNRDLIAFEHIGVDSKNKTEHAPCTMDKVAEANKEDRKRKKRKAGIA